MFEFERPFVISHRNEIEQLPPESKKVHFTFRPSNKDIFKLLDVCPSLQVVQLPPFVINRVSETINEVFSIKGIELSKGSVYNRGNKHKFFN